MPDGSVSGTFVCAVCSVSSDFDLRASQAPSGAAASGILPVERLVKLVLSEDLSREAKLDALVQYVTTHGGLRGPAEPLWAELSKIDWVHGRGEWPLLVVAMSRLEPAALTKLLASAPESHLKAGVWGLIDLARCDLAIVPTLSAVIRTI